MNFPYPWPPAPWTGHLLVDFSFSIYPCHTPEPLGPFLAPSPLALRIGQVSPTAVAGPPSHPGLLPKLKPCSDRKGVVGTQSIRLVSLVKRQHQPPGPSSLTQSRWTHLLTLSNKPSPSFKQAFSFLSPYNSPQTAVSPSLGTLWALTVFKVLETQDGPGPAIRSICQPFSNFAEHTSSWGQVKMQILVLQVWVGACDSAFLRGSQVLLLLLVIPDLFFD